MAEDYVMLPCMCNVFYANEIMMAKLEVIATRVGL